MNSPSHTPVRLARNTVVLAAPLALLLAATIGSQVGLGQQKVEIRGGIPVAPTGLWGKTLPKTPVVYDTGEGSTSASSSSPRRSSIRGASRSCPTAACSSPSAPAGCASFATACSTRSRSPARPIAYWAGDLGSARRRSRLHGRRAPSASSPRTGFVYLTYTKPLDDKRRRSAIARGHWDGHALTEYETSSSPTSRRHVAHRVRPRRHALHHHGRHRRQRGRRIPTPRAARCCGSTTTAACRATTRSSARPARRPEVYTLGHRSSLGLAVHPGHRRDVAQRERPERRRRDQHPQARARTTAGRS